MMRRILIGCGVIAVGIALLVVIGIILGPSLFQKGKVWFAQKVQEQNDQAAFEATWQPPSPQPDEQWLPEEVDGWRRVSAGPVSQVPALSLTRDGFTGTYKRAGQRLEVQFVPATNLEKEALLARALAFRPAGGSASSTTTTTHWGNTVQVKFGSGERLYCRSLQQILILLHTMDGVELKPFGESLLRAIDHQSQTAPTP